jgi:hypothetical protein
MKLDDFDDFQVPLTNRQKKKRPRSHLFICSSCDKGLTTSGGKCNVCGKRDKSKQSKKRDIKIYE